MSHLVTLFYTPILILLLLGQYASSLKPDAYVGFLSYAQFSQETLQLDGKISEESNAEKALIYSILVRNLDANITPEEFTFHPLLGGYGSSAWVVYLANKKIIIKIPKYINLWRGIDEIYIFMKSLNENDLFPRVIFYDERTKASGYEFVTGRHINILDLTQERELKTLAHAIKKLHETEFKKEDFTKGVFNPWDTIYNNLKRTNTEFESLPEDMRIIHDLIKGDYNNMQSNTVCLCHNDLYLNNIIFNENEKKFYFIDIDTMMPGNPLFDLAYFIAVNDLDDAEHTVLLNEYGIDIPSQDYEDLKTLISVCSLIMYVWGYNREGFFAECITLKYKKRLLEKYGSSGEK